jgi:hypothetical protein
MYLGMWTRSQKCWPNRTFHRRRKEVRISKCNVYYGNPDVDILTVGHLGPMLWFFKYFRRKFRQKNWRFWLKTKLNYPIFYHNIGFWEKRHFFAENCQKSQKIVIITSTPGCWQNNELIPGCRRHRTRWVDRLSAAWTETSEKGHLESDLLFNFILLNTVLCTMPLVLLFNTQAMHIKSFYTYTTALLWLPKNLIPWRDSNPGLLVPEANVTSTAPRRQGFFLY